jgi:hypothetical protein
MNWRHKRVPMDVNAEALCIAPTIRARFTAAAYEEPTPEVLTRLLAWLSPVTVRSGRPLSPLSPIELREAR